MRGPSSSPSAYSVQSNVKTFLTGLGNGCLKYCAIVYFCGEQWNILRVILGTGMILHSSLLYCITVFQKFKFKTRFIYQSSTTFQSNPWRSTLGTATQTTRPPNWKNSDPNGPTSFVVFAGYTGDSLVCVTCSKTSTCTNQ